MELTCLRLAIASGSDASKVQHASYKTRYKTPTFCLKVINDFNW